MDVFNCREEESFVLEEGKKGIWGFKKSNGTKEKSRSVVF